MATESNVYALWSAAQVSKGTPATTASTRLIQVAGDFNINRDDGSENFSDGDRFGDSTDYVQALVGNGNPTIECSPDELSWVLWSFMGQEAFTAKAVGTAPPKYVFEPGAGTGKWTTWWKKVGLTDVVRQKFNDCKLTGIRIEGSSANKIVKVVPTAISLDPGEIFAVDPSPTLPVSNPPFIYTEGAGSFTFDGAVFTGQSQFAVVVNNADAPWYGDDVVPKDLVAGNATVAIEGITLLLDAQTYQHYCKIIYGTPTPATGAKPLHTLPARGSYSFNISRGAGDTRCSLKVEVPVVKWSPDMAIAPNPDGGPVELALVAGVRKQAAAPRNIRITVETGNGVNAAHAS